MGLNINSIHFIFKKYSPKLILEQRMKNGLIVIALILTISAQAQHKYTISGQVYDKSGESLIGANVVIKELTVGTVTNPYGFYSLTVKEGTYTLEVSYMGFKSEVRTVTLDKNLRLVFNLEDETELIESVTVTSERRDVNVKQVEMSSEKLDIKTIQRIPTFMGEADVIKVIQMQPGVSVVGEGTSGFYVRGGAVDQNLILLDEAVVYNPSHVGGLFSVFNPDAVKSVKLYKGGIPAHFGGRQASVLDVQMRDGNSQEISAKGGIGTLASRLTVEAPIVKDKGSILLSGRRTYYDLFFPLFNNEVLDNTKAYFWDGNLKANYKLNDNNRLYLSLYTGKDLMEIGDMFGVAFGNSTGTLRWNHVFNDRLFSNFMIVGTDYDYRLGVPTGSFAFEWTSQILDYSFKNDYTYFLNPNNTIKFGVQVMYHKLSPGELNPLGEESTFTSTQLTTDYSYESAIYIENEQTVTSLLTLQYGLRFSLFNNAGGLRNEYDEEGELENEIYYKQGDIYNTYYGLEPRLAVRYILTDKSSLKASYNRMNQYLHLATNTQAPTPFDIWFTSNMNIKPQKTDQIAAGYFHNFFDNKLETSVEVYYKKLNDAIDFKDHASIFGNEQLDGEVRQGSGYAYGAEFYVRKKVGDFTGWISYTYSFTRRKIEEINDNKEYPTPYDRPHDLKIIANYDISPRLNISANWVYYSAMPFTIATSYSRIGNAYYPKYSERNSYRFKGTDYHRLDLSATWNFVKPGQVKRFESSLTFSVYNAYNRHNLYSVVYVDDPNEVSGIKLEKMYLFKMIPAITYNFRF